jgi:hypothetical protein
MNTNAASPFSRLASLLRRETHSLPVDGPLFVLDQLALRGPSLRRAIAEEVAAARRDKRLLREHVKTFDDHTSARIDFPRGVVTMFFLGNAGIDEPHRDGELKPVFVEQARLELDRTLDGVDYRLEFAALEKSPSGELRKSGLPGPNGYALTFAVPKLHASLHDEGLLDRPRTGESPM